ncbi:MAG: DUF3227 domain-containing protein [Candidatus Bathyarchaeota archaeon]|nr:DUF3227 domain-containing protein [Candidatus Bathyarchaeota archaeon]
MTTEPATAFDELLLRTIDEALNSLGESVKQAIYFHIENTFGLNRMQIPENLQLFQEALEKIFGAGARLIEVQIIKKLHDATGNSLAMKKSEFEFIKYIDVAKQSYLANASAADC